MKRGEVPTLLRLAQQASRLHGEGITTARAYTEVVVKDAVLDEAGKPISRKTTLTTIQYGNGFLGTGSQTTIMNAREDVYKSKVMEDSIQAQTEMEQKTVAITAISILGIRFRPRVVEASTSFSRPRQQQDKVNLDELISIYRRTILAATSQVNNNA